MSTGTGSAGSRSLHTFEDEIAPVRRAGALLQQQLTPPSSPEADDPDSSSSARTTTFLEGIVGSYVPSGALSCPSTVIHGGETWHAIKGDGGAQGGDFVVRCRICAIDGRTATYVLRGGKSSNAWRHFENYAASAHVGDLQRRRHAAVVAYRASKTHPRKPAAGVTAGPIDGFLRTARSRVMTPAQARPHHLRFVLLMVMSLSPFALAGNQYLLEFVQGLGVSYDPPAASTVRDVLLDLFVFLTDQLRAQIKRLQGRYRGLPFFHLVTGLWTERHGSGSYGSLVLRCVDPDGVSIVELHLGVVPFAGRHDHINIQAWTSRLLRRFGVRSSDISSSTSDSGSNVKKALSGLWPRWVPCAAHTLHLAVKTALGATGETATARFERRNEPSRSSATRQSSGNPAAADLLGRVRKISNHFHKSSASFAMLNSVPFPGDAEPRKLITESPGRWGSTYLALVRLFTLMPRMIGFGDLRDLTVAQRRQRLGREDWGQLRHLIGVLQPAYEACIALQSSSSTVADAFKLVGSLRRTMRLPAFPCPKTFDKPHAVGRDDILKFLEEDERRSDVMELDNRLYKHQTVPVKATRTVDGLRSGAATFISVVQRELDRRFFNPAHSSKNWLANDAVLAATLVTPGGSAMLRKAAARVGQDNPIDCAHAAVVATAESLIDASASAPARQQELEQEPCQAQVDSFLATYSASVNTRVLKFWSARGDEYPLLMLVACALLGASGSSAASERDFSTAGMVLRKDRTTLLATHVEMHCFVRFNAHLVPSDLSAIPVLTQAARSGARASMRAISVDMPVDGGLSGDSTSSGSDAFLESTDEEE
ncbi:hypothetical protein BU14_0154s0014 [Porphyra umbilicalis]|uniref:HAT C-terminal dimerisation domain-containing protein n=1 Tax=Porphyra umbilicalis TaxID=2786 RepID=A0A1X6P8Q6_PORUM|nr:hypothetical protein BU14_0154s0014 [Porphyra umbilicalis]|eukprot:OSX77238.1 hypothetical protein BU14_0154s0014 [Porphyra umbilicalis]